MPFRSAPTIAVVKPSLVSASMRSKSALRSGMTLVSSAHHSRSHASLPRSVSSICSDETADERSRRNATSAFQHSLLAEALARERSSRSLSELTAHSRQAASSRRSSSKATFAASTFARSASHCPRRAAAFFARRSASPSERWHCADSARTDSISFFRTRTDSMMEADSADPEAASAARMPSASALPETSLS